jgi:hypothetical protein
LSNLIKSCIIYSTFEVKSSSDHDIRAIRHIITNGLSASKHEVKHALFRFGFNSQGAASSVNHFHLQMLNLDKILPKNKFSFEYVNGKLLISKDNIKITYFSLHQAHYFKIFSQ